MHLGKYLSAPPTGSIYRRVMGKLRRAMFDDSFLGFLINPYHITRRRLFSAISCMSGSAQGKLLDLGCGSKPYEALFPHVTTYDGCDLETSGHNHRQSRIDYYYDGKTLPFGNETYDWVISIETFEHIFNLDQVLHEVQRVLKPGGLLLISAPFCWGEHEVPYDFARYSSFGLVFLLKNHGFSTIQQRKTGSYLLTLTQLFQNYIFHYLLPRRMRLNFLLAPILFLPMNVIVLLLDLILPRGPELYLNNVILCQKE